ncbi:MAG: hypothetical protein JWM32_1787 [Verrucomicrobia bacterium]|nr:hypothetical protein [Verrucomicrobiota bacterium]
MKRGEPGPVSPGLTLESAMKNDPTFKLTAAIILAGVAVAIVSSISNLTEPNARTQTAGVSHVSSPVAHVARVHS